VVSLCRLWSVNQIKHARSHTFVTIAATLLPETDRGDVSGLSSIRETLTEVGIDPGTLEAKLTFGRTDIGDTAALIVDLDRRLKFSTKGGIRLALRIVPLDKHAVESVGALPDALVALSATLPVELDGLWPDDDSCFGVGHALAAYRELFLSKLLSSIFPEKGITSCQFSIPLRTECSLQSEQSPCVDQKSTAREHETKSESALTCTTRL
jgi:hypothetical protein